MASDTSPATDTAAPLHERIASFRGQSYLALLALLKNPGLPTTDMARTAGVTDDSIYRWRVEMPGFKDTMEAIREAAGDLRSEYAKAAFNEAVPRIADAMIARATGTGKDARDAQRAGERILETVGVLPKPGLEVATPTQINTFTYYLVGRDTQPQPFLIETTAKVIDAEVIGKLPAPGKDATNA